MRWPGRRKRTGVKGRTANAAKSSCSSRALTSSSCQSHKPRRQRPRRSDGRLAPDCSDLGKIWSPAFRRLPTPGTSTRSRGARRARRWSQCKGRCIYSRPHAGNLDRSKGWMLCSRVVQQMIVKAGAICELLPFGAQAVYCRLTKVSFSANTLILSPNPMPILRSAFKPEGKGAGNPFDQAHYQHCARVHGAPCLVARCVGAIITLE